MKSDTCTKYLLNLTTFLTEYETAEPTPESGQKIDIRIGKKVFLEIYYLGIHVKWDVSNIDKNQEELKDVITRISEHKEWLQTFIKFYPRFLLNRDEVNKYSSYLLVCQLRTGMDFLLEAFTDIDKKFNEVLIDLEEFGELQRLDDNLKDFKETHRPEIKPEDWPSDVPESYWWWFLF